MFLLNKVIAIYCWVDNILAVAITPFQVAGAKSFNYIRMLCPHSIINYYRKEAL